MAFNRFLIDRDYNRRIQSYDLNQLLMDTQDPNQQWPQSLNYNILYDIEQQAIAEITSYIIKRYDVNEIFRPTTTFDINTTYYSDDLTQVFAPAFSTGTTYNVGDRISYSAGTNQDYIYYCVQSGYTGNTPQIDTAYFTGGTLENGALFYVTQPAISYNIYNPYEIGDQVFIKDKIYVAIQHSDGNYLTETLTTQVASDTTSAIIPGITKGWDKYWSAATSGYTVTGIQPDTDTTGKWTQGDNRNQLMVQFVLDITLYHLSARINPRNTVELWAIRYDGNNPTQNGGVIALLKRISQGQLNLQEPELVPIKGQSLYWVSDKHISLNY